VPTSTAIRRRDHAAERDQDSREILFSKFTVADVARHIGNFGFHQHRRLL
jgi:hypothetical protein